MSDRHLVPHSRLDELKEWARRQGWKPEDTTGALEVLRLRRGRQCAIFHHKKTKDVFLTVWGDSEKLARDFLRATTTKEQPSEQLEATA